MANTTNLGLGKLAGTEKLKTFPSMQADNMDTLDTAIGAGFGKNSKPSIAQSMKNLGGGMAVLCDNNTHAAIPAGHYAYVMNHGTLTEGLYQNLSGSQIAANATLSGSNLTAVSGGGLNSLYSNLKNLSSTVKSPDSLTITRINNSFADATSIGRLSCRKVGSTVHFHGNLALAAGTTSDFVPIAKISNWNCYPAVYTTVPAQNDATKIIVVSIEPDVNTGEGTLSFYAPNGVVASFYRFFITMPYANA